MEKVRRGPSTRVDKPWGYEIRWAITESYLGKILHINRDQALSLQYHELKDESLLLTQGEVELELGEPDGELLTLRLQPGDCIRIRPQTRHRITALQDSEIFEVSTPEVEDVVRLEDRYGRRTSD